MTMVSFASNIQRSMLFSIFTLLLSNGSNGILVTAFMGSLSNNNNNNNNNRINKERPVKLRIHKQAIQKVKTLIPKEQKNPTSWLLQEYMQLPAAQYACVPLPINGSLERVYGKADEFTLQVPPIRFPISTKAGEVEIIPKVRAIVQVEPDRVTIQSISCSIEGSPAVQEWKLNDRYDLDVCATLTWEKQRHGLLNFMNEEEEEDDGDNGRDSLDDSNEIKSKSTSSSSSSFSSWRSGTLPEVDRPCVMEPSTNGMKMMLSMLSTLLISSGYCSTSFFLTRSNCVVRGGGMLKYSNTLNCF
mmetsp:Transcript_31478/g.75948  ORF Transcript_31478/g.75948 Transcript_31478/m.75948 type:complete len:301 (+) Transcript_31478:234-1136(+)